MRSFIKTFVLLIVWSVAAWTTPQEASAQQVSVSYQLFYDELSPFGMWVDYPNYGYVWIPDGEPGFRPYATRGHWVFTDDGWTWISDYPWGWATFHYGRWDYDNRFGWLWVPDNEWGPAWVSWRRSPGYFGWAPLRPGISVSMAFGRDYRERDERWIFVRERNFSRPEVNRYCVNRSNNITIIKNSTLIVNSQQDDRRNATYIAGPDRDDVQRATHATVTPLAIREAVKPGHRLSNNELQIYRPLVQRRSGNGEGPAPTRVRRLNEVRPVSERNAGKQQQQQQVKQQQQQEKQQRPTTVTPSRKKAESQPSQTRTKPRKEEKQKKQDRTKPGR